MTRLPPLSMAEVQEIERLSGEQDSLPHAIDGEKNQPRSVKPANGENAGDHATEPDYPSNTKAFLIMIACVFSMFLLSLDRTILGTAIPTITKEFCSSSDIGWYGSAYMLSNCAVQLHYGRIYQAFPVKPVFLLAVVLFEIGSAVCGAAPTSTVLIIGRAIAGAGAAGVMSGVMQIMVHVIPLHKRPLFGGMFGAVGGIASVAGPLLGGALTERASWRWCFYINLPFGAMSIAAVVFLLESYEPVNHSLSLKQKFLRLDMIGTLLFLPSMTCLILALEWGNNKYSWSNWRIILLFILFSCTFVSWLAVQFWRKDDATIPLRILTQRSIAAGFVFNAMINAAMLVLVYYLPIWFQTAHDDNPIRSSISILPTILSLVVSSILTGFFTQKVGYYCPTMIAAPIFASIGTGLLTTLGVNIRQSRWIAYQFLAGLGLGMGLQQSNLAAQTVLPRPDVPIGIAIMLFGQQIGGAIPLAIAETVFQATLVDRLQGVPGAAKIIEAGTINVQGSTPSAILPQVLSAYNEAVSTTLYLAVGAACGMIIPVMFMEWRVIKKPKQVPAQKTDNINAKG